MMAPVRWSAARGNLALRGTAGEGGREAEMVRSIPFFLHCTNIYSASIMHQTVFPGGGHRVGLGLIGLWLIETQHELVETGREMH